MISCTIIILEGLLRKYSIGYYNFRYYVENTPVDTRYKDLTEYPGDIIYKES